MISLQNKTIYDHIVKKKDIISCLYQIKYNARHTLLCDFERNIFRVTDYQIVIDGIILNHIHKLQIDKDIIKVRYETV